MDTDENQHWYRPNMSNLRIIRYDDTQKTLWNEFIKNSKNGVFLFYRDYMEYHSDRFTDHSLMFFENDKLVAVMPANIKENVMFSHGGLTFGGIISDKNMKISLMLEIFDKLKEHLKKLGIVKVVYKTIPYIYSSIPAEEDIYALFLQNSKLMRRDVSSTIDLDEKIAINKGRKWSIKKSKANGIDIGRSYNFKDFMEIEENNLLKKYGVKPTHTADEMQLLADRFPENIKLFTAQKNSAMVAGVIVYESDNVAHTQYIAASEEGKELYATDILLDFLINEYYSDKKYFDFGISTENGGLYLNEGLVKYKESFGARAIVHDFYEFDI